VSYRLSYSLSNINIKGGEGSELLRSCVTSYRCHRNTHVTNVRTSRLSLSGCSLTRLGRYPDSIWIPTNQYDTMLFGDGLGMLNIKPVRLELIDGAKPYHARPFPVPQSLEATTKTEMKRLTDIDVFNRSSDSEWAAPTFIQAKKTGDVRILTDFRRLNAQIKRKPFPLPKIIDLLRKLSGFKYATTIDLVMGYYHIPLDLEAQKLCTTILPWGKYQYKRLSMGVKTSPDIFQRIMYE
jgi:hypothetical protein